MHKTLDEISNLEQFIILDTFDNDSTLLFENPIKIYVGTYSAKMGEVFNEIEEWNRNGYYIVGFINYDKLVDKSIDYPE